MHIKIINEIKKAIIYWSRRKLSLFDTCASSKMFILSQVTHILQSISLPTKILDIIDRMLFQYIWGNSDQNKRVPEKVKRTTICLPIAEGGLGMISIRDQQKVMYINWVKKGINTPNETHRNIIYHEMCVWVIDLEPTGSH